LELHCKRTSCTSSRPQQHNWSQHDAPPHQRTIWHTRMRLPLV